MISPASADRSGFYVFPVCFFEDTVDIPIGIPLAMNVGSFISPNDSLCNDMLHSCCSDFEGDNRMDFLLDWFPFSNFCCLLEVVDSFSIT